jgi:hypothetical protein
MCKGETWLTHTTAELPCVDPGSEADFGQD